MPLSILFLLGYTETAARASVTLYLHTSHQGTLSVSFSAGSDLRADNDPSRGVRVHGSIEAISSGFPAATLTFCPACSETTYEITAEIVVPGEVHGQPVHVFTSELVYVSPGRCVQDAPIEHTRYRSA